MDRHHSASDSIGTDTRLPSLDIVRGIAVLGILVPNIIGMGQPIAAYGWPGGFLSPPGPADDWLWAAQLVLVDGKFRGLFTLLFGAGMVLFFARAQQRGAGHSLMARRLGWLGLFGFLHWLLLWRGDILMAYAVAGLLVLACVGWDWTKQIALGLAGYGAGAITGFVSSVPVAQAAGAAFPQGSEMAEIQRALSAAQDAEMVDAAREAALMRAGDHIGLIHHALESHLTGLPRELLLTLFETAPLMLIGMGVLGAGLFDGRVAAARQKAWGWSLWVAGTIASIPIALGTMADGIGYWESFAASNGWLPLPQLASAVGLLCLLASWGQHSGSVVARRLADAGRCAFSNYIGCSALALAVFAGSGLGLFGMLGRMELYALVPLFWLLMLLWPAWWLARFRHGPLEWLWRCLTYWQWMPLRR